MVCVKIGERCCPKELLDGIFIFQIERVELACVFGDIARIGYDSPVVSSIRNRIYFIQSSGRTGDIAYRYIFQRGVSV